MWIKVGSLNVFIKTADEGDYTWEFDGENYSIHRKNALVVTSPRYSLVMLTAQKVMPKLCEARAEWLNRALDNARKLAGYVD